MQPFTKQHFVIIQRYAVLQEAEKKPDIINRPIKHFMFLRKYMEKQFFFLDKEFFVTQLPSNVVIQFDELCGLRHTAFT